jgi:DNA-binding response OmpR family regulator
MSILSINGNKPFNFILQTVLSKDFQVYIASDPINGLKHMKNNGRISLAIVDVDAYEEDAFEFVDYVKASLLFQVPVILLTSNKSYFVKQKISQLNENDFFVKPFNPLDLLKRVKQILSGIQLDESKI